MEMLCHSEVFILCTDLWAANCVSSTNNVAQEITDRRNVITGCCYVQSWHSFHCVLHQLEADVWGGRQEYNLQDFRQQKHRSVKGLITEVILLVCSVSAYLWLAMYIKNIEKKTELIWDRAGAAKGGQEEDVCFSAGSLCWMSLQTEKKDIVVSSPELGSVWAHMETSTSQSSTNTTQTWPDVNLSDSNDSCIR